MEQKCQHRPSRPFAGRSVSPASLAKRRPRRPPSARRLTPRLCLAPELLLAKANARLRKLTRKRVGPPYLIGQLLAAAVAAAPAQFDTALVRLP